MARVLLTGASGFLAQHIGKKFSDAGHEVVGVDKRPLGDYKPDHFIQTDVRELGFRDLLGIDVVVHLAWRTNIQDCIRHPEEAADDNINMTIHLLEVSKEAGVKKFFFPSTASLYGHNPVPWKEDMPLSPIEPYSWHKLACEYACKMYAGMGLDTVTARFFQVFGEYQREDTVIAVFKRLKNSGKSITLNCTLDKIPEDTSDLKTGARDFIYAGDLAEAVYLLSTDERAGKGEVYNVGGMVHSIKEIADAVGGKVQWLPRRPWEVERHEADLTKLESLGWKPKTDVISWIKKYI